MSILMNAFSYQMLKEMKLSKNIILKGYFFKIYHYDDWSDKEESTDKKKS